MTKDELQAIRERSIADTAEDDGHGWPNHARFEPERMAKAIEDRAALLAYIDKSRRPDEPGELRARSGPGTYGPIHIGERSSEPMPEHSGAGTMECVKAGLDDLRERGGFMAEVQRHAAEHAVYVDPALDWHDVGCVKRYGAVSDAMCACEKLRAENRSAAHE